MANAVLASGRWCEDCAFFEDNDEFLDDRCMACGCSASKHSSVDVVLTEGT